MKKLITLAAAAVLVLTSCDFLKTGYDLNDSKQVDKIFERISSHLDGGSAIYKIEFYFHDKLELYPTIVHLSFTEPGSSEQSRVTVGLQRDNDYVTDNGNKVSDTMRNLPENMRKTMGLVDRDPSTGIKLSELDHSRIADNVNTAARMLKDAGLPFSGVESYEITVPSAEAAAVRHEFKLSSRLDSKTVAGNRGLETHTSYAVYTFTADAAGNVEIVPAEE